MLDVPDCDFKFQALELLVVLYLREGFAEGLGVGCVGGKRVERAPIGGL